MAAPNWLGWRFKDGTPLWFTVIVGFVTADSVTHFGLLMTVSTWAQSSRDTVHSYRVPFQGWSQLFRPAMAGTVSGHLVDWDWPVGSVGPAAISEP